MAITLKAPDDNFNDTVPSGFKAKITTVASFGSMTVRAICPTSSPFTLRGPGGVEIPSENSQKTAGSDLVQLESPPVGEYQVDLKNPESCGFSVWLSPVRSIPPMAEPEAPVTNLSNVALKKALLDSLDLKIYQPGYLDTLRKKWAANEFDPLGETDKQGIVGKWMVGLPLMAGTSSAQVKESLSKSDSLDLYESEYYTFNENGTGTRQWKSTGGEFTWKVAEHKIQVDQSAERQHFLVRIDGVFYRPSREMLALPLIKVSADAK